MSTWSAQTVPTSSQGSSAAKAWARALSLTAPIHHRPARILPTVIDEMADVYGDRPALIAAEETLTYRALAERCRRYARWALDQGITPGQTVGLLMPNRPEYLAVWLGISRVGGVVALLNTQVTGQALANCLNQVRPTHVIVDAEFAGRLHNVLDDLTTASNVWLHGEPGHSAWPRVDREIEQFSTAALADAEAPPITVDDRALYIYTSGTTGLPKAANISHARVM